MMLIKNRGKTELTKEEIKEALLPIECAIFPDWFELTVLTQFHRTPSNLLSGHRKRRAEPTPLMWLQIDEEDPDQLPTLLGFSSMVRVYLYRL